MKFPGKKTILVTGATGFIGSNFINVLCESQYDVIGIKRKKSSSPRVKINRSIQWYSGSLASIPSDLLNKVDAIVHLAAHSANHPYDTLYNCIDQNVVQHFEFIKRAYDSGIRNFLLAGSCFEYGDSGMRYQYIPIDAPLEPKESYPVSKAMFFLVVKEFFRDKEASVSYQRIFQVFGDGETESRFWPTLKKKALLGEDMLMTQGEQLRDFINVLEVANILKSKLKIILNSNSSFFKVENLGSGKPTTLMDFAKYWWTYWGSAGELVFGAIPYRSNEVMRFIPEIDVENDMHEE